MAEAMNHAATSPQTGATAVLVLGDGTLVWGQGIGAQTSATGEVCFNTSMTGYQEIITDPSYAGQIINFTFPHIGNVGTNDEDIESLTPAARAVVMHASVTDPANFRASRHLHDWLVSHDLPGITGVDTRRLTRHVRQTGAPNGVVCHSADGNFDIDALVKQATGWPGLEGMDLAKDVSCTQSYEWDESVWALGEGYGKQDKPRFHVVAVDFGVKRNILRCLAAAGCRVTVVPANASADDILAHKPDGVFLSNGPGDPAATGVYAIPMINGVIASGIPLFGICLGHQMLALAVGAGSAKMQQGHRGANHPVKDLETGKVEITSQNHGFVIDDASLPDGVTQTHTSLFDGTLEGIKLEGKPVFSVQYHPEASPGPQDSHYLFDRFVKLMEG